MFEYRMVVLSAFVAMIVGGSVSAQEVSPPPSAEWSSSLGQIQQEIDQLLLINDQLSQERNRLNAELASLQKGMVAQREKNQRDLLALQERRSAAGPSGNAAEMKSRIAEKERALERKKDDLARLKAREKNAGERITLRQLNIAELELEKKALLLDAKVKVEVASGKEKTELQQLQDKVVSQQEQEKLICSKIDALKRNAPPYIEDAKVEGETNVMLKEQTAGLESQRAALLEEQSGLAQKRAALDKNKTFGKIQSLNERRDALRIELAALKEKQKNTLSSVEVKSEDVVEGTVVSLADQMKAMEAENKKITSEISNLRENIAVLEYQVNSLERYRLEKKK